MKNLVTILMNNPITSLFFSLITYIFYGLVIGVSLAPSVILVMQYIRFGPEIFASYLNMFLFALVIRGFNLFILYCRISSFWNCRENSYTWI